MPSYIVAYDLDGPNRNYDCLNKKLEAYGTHWKPQGSVWIIKTEEAASTVRDKLRPCLDKGDELFVLELGEYGAWIGYNKDVDRWIHMILKKNAR